MYRWTVDTQKKHLYLTFDDGPTPEITQWVAGQLKRFDAKATFFVLGKNVEKHPKLAHQLLDAGHSLGNHSYSHPDGWKTQCFTLPARLQTRTTGNHRPTRTLKPCYSGPLTVASAAKQAEFIQRSHRIVMMDVMPGDFDLQIAKETCLHRAINHADRGSIICLHDSEKGLATPGYVLPRLLEHFTAEGFQFQPLNQVPDVLLAIR
ncbi:MAG: polysaccharide deacetylase family protein [Bacteroidia bacterium]